MLVARGRAQVGVHSAKTDWSRRSLDFQYMDYDDQAAHIRETRSYVKNCRNAGPLRGRGRLHLKPPGGELLGQSSLWLVLQAVMDHHVLLLSDFALFVELARTVFNALAQTAGLCHHRALEGKGLRKGAEPTSQEALCRWSCGRR